MEFQIRFTGSKVVTTANNKFQILRLQQFTTLELVGIIYSATAEFMLTQLRARLNT